MNENNKINNNFERIKFLLKGNLRNIIILIGVLFTTFILFQAYTYYSIQELKKTSINFFNSIDANEDIIENLKEIKKGNDIFATLSKLKIIEKNNQENNFNISNELYKEIILSKKIDNLYKSAIALHASHILLNASYVEKTNIYFTDISIFIDNIDSEIESYFSLKKELLYLLLVATSDINQLDYKNNSKALNMYNEIFNSTLISSSVKERVKKIHEFQIYN